MSTKIFLFKQAETVERYAPNEVIFTQGDAGDKLYVIQSGEVELLRDGERIEVLGEGDLFGEMALLEDAPRSATAVARTSVVVVPVDERRFNFMTQNTPNFAWSVMRILSERLRAAASTAHPAPAAGL